MAPAIVFISLFATAFGIWFYYLKTRNSERLALIQSGADASAFYSKKKPGQSSHSGLVLVFILGMLFLSVGLGIIVGYGIEQSMLSQAKALNPSQFQRHFPQAYFTSIFIFSGLGLIISYFIMRKIQKKDADEERNLQIKQHKNL